MAMIERNPKTVNDDMIFSALLTPHRSLGRPGFVALMTVLLFAWLVFGAFFLSLGAWPVFWFFGLDIVAIYFAFRLNYRAARAREEIIITRRRLEIRQIMPSGQIRIHKFNPFWTKFSVSRHKEIGITRMVVASGKSMVTIGGFLNPADRESFAAAFARALTAAKKAAG